MATGLVLRLRILDAVLFPCRILAFPIAANFNTRCIASTERCALPSGTILDAENASGY